MEQGLGRASLQYRGELPAQIEGVLHGDVHPLTGFGRVRVAGVTGDEDPRSIVATSVDVVETIRQTLANLIDAPPGHVGHRHRVGVHDAVGRGDDVVDLRPRAELGIGRVNGAQINVEADQVTTLARNDDDRSLFGADHRLLADVREIGVYQHVQHTPGVILRVPLKRAANGLADSGTGAIAADYIAGAKGARGAGGPVVLVGFRERDFDGIVLVPIGGL